VAERGTLPSTGRQLGLIVGTFAALGVALGTVGYVTAAWARAQFVVAATGSQPAEFGPVFVALSTFQTTVTMLLVGPVVGAALGLLSGSRFPAPLRAGGVAAAGTLVGFLLMTGLGVAGIGLVSGPGTGQTYAPSAAAGPLLLSALATGAVGGVAGVVGSALVR